MTEQQLNTHIGQWLRTMRLRARISLRDAGNHCGVTYQQMQKVEAGRNRISAARFFHLCQLYGVDECQLAQTLAANGLQNTHIQCPYVQPPALRNALEALLNTWQQLPNEG